VTSASPSSAKPWEHAKSGEGSATDPLAARFVESLSYDTRLYDADIRGSIAHARMLRAVGLISGDDLAAIERGLAEVRREIETAPAGPTAVGVPGAWAGWRFELEDVHMCVEAALVAKVGDPGRKLHTGRSRNDQVAVDLRLWLADACEQVRSDLAALCAAFDHLAARQGSVLIPTYTHLQRAQPARVGAECLAWKTMIERDAHHFLALKGDPLGVGACPLGSGAVAGSILPLDREMTAAALGFSTVAPSSIDATASRDEALDFLYAAARTGIHLSRLAEQWIIYTTTEFGFLTLAEAFTTGSSMMPQKRNPDMLELVRGRSGALVGSLMALLTTVKGLPLAYNRDLQDDKRHLFSSYDALRDCLKITARIVETARFNPERIAPTLDRGFLDATALAEYLVTKGVPFRTAHQIVGSLVRACEASGRGSLTQLTLAEITGAVAAAGFAGANVGPDAFDHLGAQNVVDRYRTIGHGGLTTASSSPGVAGAPRAESTSVSTATAGSESPATGVLFAGAEDEPTGRKASDAALAPVLAEYEQIGRTLDDLPYTPEFDRLHAAALRSLPGVSKKDLLHKLHNLRKRSALPKVGRSPALPVRLDPGEEEWLREAVVRTCGSLGQRDQLPYDERFEPLVAAFNARTGRSLDPHTVWRLTAKLAK
jgi:argininosuccinate lyase